MKKTIVLVSAFPPGELSLNEYGFHLAINFAKNDDVNKIIILADILPAPKAELVLDPKIEIRRIWSFNKLFTFATILREIRDIKPAGIIYNLQTASFGDREIPAALGLFTPFFGRLMGQKSGIIAHNMISGVDLNDTVLKGKKLRQLVVKLGGKIVDWAIMHASYVTVTLDSYFEYYHKAYPKADLTMVPHGTFDTEIREMTPYENRAKIIVTMGKFGTYKRLETLLDAMEILIKNPKHKDAKLVIGGTDHPNFKGYMKSLETQNIGKSHLIFHGYVSEEDIPQFFDQAQLSVFDYSSTTGSSGVLHQTASYGAVPVFPAIGDFVDVCNSEGIFGENYVPNDAQSMAEAMIKILDDPKRAIDIGNINRKASEQMPMSKIVEFHLNRF